VPSSLPNFSFGLILYSIVSCIGQNIIRVLPSWNSVPESRKADFMRTPCTLVPLVLLRSRML